MKRNILSLVFFLICIHIHVSAQNWMRLGDVGMASCLAVDASGNLYAANYLNQNGYKTVIKWNGIKWQELGAGTDPLNGDASINSITFDSEGNLYAAGNFTNKPYEKGVIYVAKWNGTNWTELDGNLMNAVRKVVIINAVVADPSGNVYAAGYFNSTNTYDISVMKWDGQRWTDIGINPPYTQRFQGGVYDMISDKSGNIYVAGGLQKSNEVYYIAKWDGSSWSEVGTGVNALNANGPIYSLAIDSKNNLYAGGYFKNAANHYYVAKWNGNTWSQVDAGMDSLNPDTGVQKLMVDTHDNLYAGGTFVDNKGGVYISKWDGTSWSAMGPGMSNPLEIRGQIMDIISDPNSENLFASGMLFIDSDQANNYIVQWKQPLNTATAVAEKPVINIYPNPCNGLIQIPSANEALTVTVLDVQGRQISSQILVQGDSYMDYSDLTPGMYTLIFIGNNISYAPVKFVKE